LSFSTSPTTAAITARPRNTPTPHPPCHPCIKSRQYTLPLFGSASSTPTGSFSIWQFYPPRIWQYKQYLASSTNTP
jgi:hypothetical protein